MLEPDRILSGIARVLERSVLSELPAGFARGQLYAVLELLENLQGRLAWEGPLLAGEASMLHSVAEQAAAAFSGDDDGPLARRLRAYVTEAPSALIERVLEGRSLVCDLIAGGFADEGPLASSIDAYLTNAAILKAMGLKPSRLSEISQG